MIIERLHNAQEWDRAVLKSQHATFLQSYAWGEFQNSLQRDVLRLVVREKGDITACAQLIRMGGRFGQHYWYCPRGPLAVDTAINHERVMEKIVAYVKDAADIPSCMFIRYDATDRWEHALAKSGPMMQPWATRVLDLTQSEDDILKRMKSKTRYNIRVAERHDIHVHRTTRRKALKHFWRLTQETYARQKITAHAKKYYERMYEVLTKTHRFWIYEARYKGDVVASGMFMRYGDTVTYMHGASSYEHRNVMAPFALHWHVIRDAKKRGAKIYDFFGVAATEKQRTSWAGITRFKEGFGGREISYEHTKEIPLHAKKYQLYKLLRRY